LARVGAEQRFEDFGEAFQETIRHGFLSIARDNPDRCIVVDGNNTVEAVGAEILARFEARP
jgi:dTMP kinase